MMVTGFVGGEISSITMFASATSTGATITVPGTVIAGDLLVLGDSAFGGPPSTVVPSGFTSIANEVLSTNRVIASYKLANGTEAGASLTGMDGSTQDRKILLVFRPDIPAQSVTLASVNSAITSGGFPVQTVTSGSGTAPLVVTALYSSSANFSLQDAWMDPARDGDVGNDSDLYLSWKIYNSSPVNVAVDMDDISTINCLMSWYISMSANP